MISLGLILCRLVMMNVITVALGHINLGDDALPVGCSEIKIGTRPVPLTTTTAIFLCAIFSRANNEKTPSLH